MIHKKLACSIILLLCTQILFSQEYFFRNYSVADGMTQSTAYCLMQDSRGLIWIGTNGVGVSVYDGTKFTSYNKGDGLSGNIVRSIFEDSRGNIWFGTDNGATLYDGHTMKSIGAEDGLVCSFAMRFAENSQGRIYIATNDGGLYGLEYSDSIILKNFNQYDGLVTDFIFDIHIDDSDRIWLAMVGGLNIIEFEDVNCDTIKNILSPTIQSNFITAIEQTGDNSYLLGTYGDGLVRVRESSESLSVDYPFNDEFLSDLTVWDILHRKDGETMIATEKKGILAIRDNSLLYNFNTENGLISNQVLDLAEDSEGNMWLATMGQGISMYDDNKFIKYGINDGIGGKEINKILFKDSDIILATDKGVVVCNRIDSLKIAQEKLYNQKDGLSDIGASTIISIGEQLWVGTNSGLCIIENGEVSSFNQNDQLTSQHINCLLRDSQKNIWIGTDNGYNKIVGKSVYSMTEDDGFVNSEVQTIIEDSKGRIWMGTLGGLVMLENDQYTDFIEEDGLGELRIHSLAEEESGNILIGTFGGGIFRFNIGLDSVPVSLFADKQYLSSNNIYSLQFIDNRTLVSTTDKGFDLIAMNTKELPATVLHFNMYDGFSEGENNLNSVTMDKSGQVWFGTSDGLVRFNPRYDPDYSLRPNVMLTNVRLFFEGVDWNAKGFERQKWFNIPKDLVLNHREDHLTFDFTGSCFHDPKELQFSYYLEGQSKSWSPYDKSNEATFSGLSAGSYIFKVKAKNAYNTESEIAEFAFIIKPPLWQRTWFIIMLALISIAIIIIIIRLRERALVQEKIKLENIVEERTREVVEQKDQITKQHDIVLSQKKEITSSIEYAERIQVAVLPDQQIIKKAFSDSFILFRPKDIVSGDFYWMTSKSKHTIFAACDCTGHGVPGAFMSLLGVSFLNKIVNESGEVRPAKILELLRENIIESLKQKGLAESTKDGMDLALCSVSEDQKKLLFAGANNPVYIIRKEDNEYNLFEIKGDRMPVGFHAVMNEYSQHEFELKKGDSIYMFSDGIVDQFGGEKQKKFMAKRFKQVLLDNQDNSMEEQKALLNNALEDWMSYPGPEGEEMEQIDDIIVMGVRI